MAQEAGGEVVPQLGRGVSRRDFGKIVAFVALAGGCYYIAGRGHGPNGASNPNVPDPNAELAALAAANEGKPIAGNAIGNYPERTIKLVQEATNIVVVQFTGDDTVSIGTAWKAQLGEQVQDSEVTLATAGHVLTGHGRHALEDIAAVWVGHPSSRDSFHCVDASALRMALASRSDQIEPMRDAGVIRMPRHAAPAQLAAAPALRLAAQGGVPAQTSLLVAGVPEVFVPQYSSTGIESAPLYAQVMLPQHSSDVPDGCIGLAGLSGPGVSGASVVGPEGQVVGMVVDYVTRDPHVTVAAQSDVLRQLA